MAHSATHPALLGEWFADMPAFLARDAARLATEPAVILAAAARLASLGGATNREIIADLSKRYRDQELELHLRALSIKAGDRALKRETLAFLDSEWSSQRIRAAVILCLADVKQGRQTLIRLFGKGDEGAARALGLVGRDTDTSAIDRSLSRDPGNPELLAARGEIKMRRLFPYHHSALRRRVPDMMMLEAGDGLYEMWFGTIDGIFRSGARTSAGVIDAIEELRHRPVGNGDKEVQRRRLKALSDFWSNVDKRIKNISSQPVWPENFQAARRALQRKAGADDSTPRVFAERVSSAIAICSVVGGLLGYEKLSMPTDGLRVLTPGGKRVLDGNIATAWYADGDGTLSLEHQDGGRVVALWIMNACQHATGASQRARGAKTLDVTGSGSGKTWSETVDLDEKSRHFQRVSLGGKRARRLSLRIPDRRGKGPACISEIRIDIR